MGIYTTRGQTYRNQYEPLLISNEFLNGKAFDPFLTQLDSIKQNIFCLILQIKNSFEMSVLGRSHKQYLKPNARFGICAPFRS